MPDYEATLIEQNPWWFGQGTAEDPHLKRLAKAGILWDPPLMHEISLTLGDTHTLRGPRQAGKTTTIKRLIDRLVQAGETRVLYVAFDYASRASEITDVIRLAKKIHPSPQGPWYLFLDEVTSVPDWQIGVKVAWDSGLTSDDALVLTASSARDLKQGAERLPGRRGRGRDYLQLPMSFRDFCQVAHGVGFVDGGMAAEELLTEKGEQIALRLQAQRLDLETAFSAYLRIGGFPVAVADYVSHRQSAGEPRPVPPELVQTLWNVIAGDVTRWGRDQTAALKLVQTVGDSLGATLSWTTAARSMGIEKPDVARQYVELLAESFVLLAVYFWDLNRRSLEPRKQRKVYWIDPLVGAMPSVLIPGTAKPSIDGLIENVVAGGLFRAAAQSLIQANAVPGAIGYWRSVDGREIDFVVPRLTAPELGRLPIEVKGDNATNIAAARASIHRSYRSGIILSRTVLDWRPDVATLPVWLFLAALRERPYRPLTIG